MHLPTTNFCAITKRIIANNKKSFITPAIHLLGSLKPSHLAE